MKSIIRFFLTNQYRIFFIFTVVVCMLPLTWFKGMPIAGEEYYAIDYAKWGELFKGGWFDAVNWGEYSPLSSFKLQAAFFKGLYLLGFAKVNALIVWHLLLFLFAGLGFYACLYKLFGKKINPVIYFIGSVYYVYTPYFLNISVFLSPPRIFLAFLPAVFLVFIRFYKNQKILISDLLTLNVILFVVSPIFVNIPLGLVLLFLVFIGLFYFCISLKVSWRSSVLKIGFFLVTYVLLNVWWLLPTANKQFSQSAGLKEEAASFVTTDKSETADVISLFGSWAFREKIANTNYNYFPYFRDYDEFPGVIVRYTPYLVSIFALFIFGRSLDDKKPKDAFLFFIFLLHITFLFLAKGVAEPFGFIYSLLYKYFPLFWIYREPYAKFMPVVVFTSSILLVYGGNEIWKLALSKLSSKIKARSLSIGFVAISTVSLLILIKPYILGTVVWDINDQTRRSYHIAIPDGWKDIQEKWKPKSGYYFQFPSTDIYDSYNWQSGYNGNPYLLLTNAKILNPERGYSASENPERRYITSYLYRNIIENPARFVAEATRYNVAGILLQKDTVYNGFAHAFSVIQKVYSSVRVFENTNAAVYDVAPSKNALVSIVNSADVINVTKEQFPYYHLIRKVTPQTRLISVGTGNRSSVSVIKPQKTSNSSHLIYSLPKEVSNSYTIFFAENVENIGKAMIDGTPVVVKPNDSYSEISVRAGQTCCSNLEIAFKGPLISGGSFPLKWYRQPKSLLNVQAMVPTEVAELRPNLTEVSLAKLPNFEPTLVNHIQLIIKGNFNYPVGISLVQADRETMTTRYFANYRIQDISAPVNIVYDGISNPISPVFKESDYYVAIYGINLTSAQQKVIDYPTDISYRIDVGTLITERIPLVFTINDSTRDVGISEEFTYPQYQSINSSLTILKIPANLGDTDLLQFKNSYSPEWRFVLLDKTLFDQLALGRVSIFEKWKLYLAAQRSPKPTNYEYYSNGWELPKGVAGQYAAILFWPTLLQEITFVISFAFLLLSCLALLVFGIRKFRIKGTK